MKRNNSGGDRIAELTQDAIRMSGQNVAQHVIELGKKVRVEAESVEAFASQVAQAITEATSQIADRVGRLLENCQAARASMEQHRALLSMLPEAKALPAPAARREEVAGLEAVGAELEDQIAEPHSFIKR